MIDGRQRLHNIHTKVRLYAERTLRQALSGEIDICPCSGDYERDCIIREFDRLAKTEALPSSPNSSAN